MQPQYLELGLSFKSVMVLPLGRAGLVVDGSLSGGRPMVFQGLADWHHKWVSEEQRVDSGHQRANARPSDEMDTNFLLSVVLFILV